MIFEVFPFLVQTRQLVTRWSQRSRPRPYTDCEVYLGNSPSKDKSKIRLPFTQINLYIYPIICHTNTGSLLKLFIYVSIVRDCHQRRRLIRFVSKGP